MPPKSKAYDEIKAGIEDAIAYAKGDGNRGTAHVVEVPAIDVRAVRAKIGMTQPEFARIFRISLPTLRKWEQGQRRPSGAAMVLLTVIDREPQAVLRALKSAA